MLEAKDSSVDDFGFDRWIAWGGTGSEPIPLAKVQVRLRNGRVDEGRSKDFSWTHLGKSSDIVEYRYLRI